MRVYIHLYCFIAFCLLASLHAPALAGGPPERNNSESYRIKYKVQRNGSPIGHYHFDVRQSADRYSFKAELDIEVTILGFTVYELEHSRNEKWRDGILTSLEGQSVYDDDEHYKMRLERKGDQDYSLTVNNTTKQLNSRVVSFSPRKPDDWDKARLITLKGEADAITKKDLGKEKITVNSTEYNAGHHLLKGDVVRDLWYDAKGHLLKLSYKKDGDTITFLRTAMTKQQ